ncbi:MFS transporter [Tumebacillus sp. DT12]|uniref:MFS transporter n=1 Tax=Tumebacillus lacus TaxID=2995335 RepID=A0ABT3WXL5_9BACL|nr:MFS transporter [Tumebacillus lacus]MCX7569418.1 MFS transporter [Tumebacillus lacus]
MLFQNRTFRYLFISYGFSLLGSCFASLALNLWVLQTTGSARIMFLLFLVVLVVTLSAGNIAGTFADRFDRRTIMWVCDLLNAAIMAVISLCMYLNYTPLALVLVIVGLQTFVMLFHGPAFHASLSNILQKELIPKATASINIIDNVARILGLAVGGTVVGFFGTAAATGVNAVTYVLSAIFVLFAGKFQSAHVQNSHAPSTDEPITADSPVTEPVAEPTGTKGFWQDFTAGFRFMFGDPFTRSIIILMPVISAFFTMSLMMIQVMTVIVWKAAPAEFGIIEACVPLGYITASWILMKLDTRIKKKGFWIFVGTLGLGPIFILISRMNEPAQVYPLIFALGFMYCLCTLLLNVAIRVEVDSGLQGRVFGMVATVNGPLLTLCVGFSTFFADSIGPQNVLLFAGALLTLCAAVLTVVLTPLRRYQSLSNLTKSTSA